MHKTNIPRTINFSHEDIGRKFGKFTVLEIKRFKDRYKANCKCECGTTKWKNWSELLRGHNIQSCGRCDKVNPIEYIGTKIGKLQILKITKQLTLHNVKRTYAEVQCDCGTICEKEFYLIYRGKISSCGCLLKQKYLNQSLPKEIVAQNIILNSYKKNAAARNLSFKLTDDEVLQICSQNCYWCGEAPYNNFNWKSYKKYIGSYVYNGIDRKDNTIGYTKENSVSSCQMCNFGKRNISESDFLSWIEKVYSHSINRDTVAA
jgi:hypothetical protein